SLSPFFQEDLPRFEPQQKLLDWFGQRRLNDLAAISVKQATQRFKQTNIECLMFYGEKEKRFYKKLVERVLDTAVDLNLTAIEVKQAGHSFSSHAYAKAIAKML